MRPGADHERGRLGNLAAAVALDLVTGTNDAVSTATGLPVVDATALTALANVADGRSIDVLRGLVGLSQPGCARLVDRLQRRGLVTRTADDDDHRIVRVRLTPAGRRQVAIALRARADAVRARLGALDPLQARALEDLLAVVAAAAVAVPEDANPYCRSCDPAACGFPDRCPTTIRAHDLATKRAGVAEDACLTHASAPTASVRPGVCP